MLHSVGFKCRLPTNKKMISTAAIAIIILLAIAEIGQCCPACSSNTYTNGDAKITSIGYSMIAEGQDKLNKEAAAHNCAKKGTECGTCCPGLRKSESD